MINARLFFAAPGISFGVEVDGASLTVFVDETGRSSRSDSPFRVGH